MGFKRYSEGTFVDCENVRRYENGAWVDCEFVRRYENGAWVDVWSANSTPTATFYEAANIVTGSTKRTYSTSEHRLDYSFSNVITGTNNIVYKITKKGGFGKTINVTYTFNQTMSLDAYASIRFLDQTYTGFTNTNGWAYQYYSSNGTETVSGSITMDVEQEYIFLLVESYGTDFSGSIYNIYINDELVTFI